METQSSGGDGRNMFAGVFFSFFLFFGIYFAFEWFGLHHGSSSFEPPDQTQCRRASTYHGKIQGLEHAHLLHIWLGLQWRSSMVTIYTPRPPSPFIQPTPSRSRAWDTLTFRLQSWCWPGPSPGPLLCPSRRRQRKGTRSRRPCISRRQNWPSTRRWVFFSGKDAAATVRAVYFKCRLCSCAFLPFGSCF